jgi:hypothetical protein
MWRLKDMTPSDYSHPYRLQRYEYLVARRDERTLTPEEHQELIELSDHLEVLQAERIAALIEEARSRGVPLDSVLPPAS